MTHYKDFFSDTLDDAIREACAYFGVAREKLEIEIINDAKSGIFGLVGKKQAQIRAARVQLENAAAPDSRAEGQADGPAAPVPPASDARRPKEPRPKEPRPKEPAPEKPGSKAAKSDEPGPKASRPKAPRSEAPRSETSGHKAPRPEERGVEPGPKAADEHPGHDAPEFDLENGDRELLFATVRTVVQRLVEPIVGSVDCRVEIHGKRVRATVDCGDASPLLVGRDGQTLAAVQYLAARMIGRQLGGMVRLNIDAGRYRERQDDKLKELALSLAETVRKTGRPQSTKPLSAYQRRIIHLALETDPDLETRSKGEGAQRRVIIHPKKEA